MAKSRKAKYYAYQVGGENFNWAQPSVGTPSILSSASNMGATDIQGNKYFKQDNTGAPVPSDQPVVSPMLPKGFPSVSAKGSELNPYIQSLNTMAQTVTGIANVIGDNKENRNNQMQYLHSIEPRAYESNDGFGLNHNPIFMKHGGGMQNCGCGCEEKTKYQVGGEAFNPAEQKIVDQYIKLGYNVSKVNGQLHYAKNANTPSSAQPVQATQQLPVQPQNAPTQLSTKVESATDSRRPAQAPVASTPVDSKGLKGKYKDNPYLVGENNRYYWATQLDREFPLTQGTVREAVSNAAKTNKVDPALLYASAMEEGMSGAIDDKNWENASEAFTQWESKNPEMSKKFPVDSFYNYGLDQFAGMVPALQKKGYLPKDFNQNFTTFDAMNEKNEKIKASAFNTDSNAVLAKSAMMRLSQDQLGDYTKKRGYNLTPEQQEFFLLANYNGGEGNMQKMIDSYNQKGYLKDNKFLDPNFSPASYGSIYKNVQARIQAAKMLRNEHSFDSQQAQQQVTQNGQQGTTQMKTGGSAIPETYGLGGNQEHMANVEAEKGEVYTDTSGNMGQVAEDAPTHEQGGVMLPQVHRVLENTSNIRKDKDSKYLKLDPNQTKALTGVETTKHMSHAEAMVEANKFYEEQRNNLTKKIAMASKDRKDLDKYGEKAVQLNLDSFKSLPTQQGLFDVLFNHQEAVKAEFGIGEEDPEQAKKGGWIQHAINPAHKGYCTPMSKPTCTGHRKALAMRFKHGDLHKGKYGIDVMQLGGYAGSKSGAKTPAGNSDAFQGDFQKYLDDLKTKGFKYENITDPKDLQTALYDFQLEHDPTAIKSAWSEGMHQAGMSKAKKMGLIDDKGNFKEGVLDSPENLKKLRDLYPDGILGVRTLRLAKGTPKITWGDDSLPQDQKVPLQAQKLDTSITPTNIKQQPGSEFNEPLRWFDVASPVNAYVDALKKEPEKYNPAEIGQLRYKLQDPTAALQQNQSDYNAALQSIQQVSPSNIGMAMANTANLTAQKYTANNQVLGQYENQNAQIKNNEILYNTEAKNKQSLSDQQSREIFETKVLTSKAKQQEQKLTAMDALYKTIAENRALNRNGNLIMKFSRAFDQYGNYNGYNPIFGVNPALGVSSTSNYTLAGTAGKPTVAGGVQQLKPGESYYNRRTGKTLYFDGKNFTER